MFQEKYTEKIKYLIRILILYWKIGSLSREVVLKYRDFSKECISGYIF